MTEKHRAKQRCVGMSAEQLNLQQGAPIQLLSKRPGSTMWRVKDLQTGAPYSTQHKGFPPMHAFVDIRMRASEEKGA